MILYYSKRLTDEVELLINSLIISFFNKSLNKQLKKMALMLVTL